MARIIVPGRIALKFKLGVPVQDQVELATLVGWVAGVSADFEITSGVLILNVPIGEEASWIASMRKRSNIASAEPFWERTPPPTR